MQSSSDYTKDMKEQTEQEYKEMCDEIIPSNPNLVSVDWLDSKTSKRTKAQRNVNMSDELFGDEEEVVVETVVEKPAEQKEQKKEEAKVNTAVTDSGIEMPEAKTGSGNKYWKRSKTAGEKNYLRFFPFEHEGKKCLAVVKKGHWIEGKYFDCTGAACVNCAKSVPLTERYRINVVERKKGVKPRVMIYEAPKTVYILLCDNIKASTPEKILGNTGSTFELTFDGKNKYGLIRFDKDTIDLKIDKGDIYDLKDNDKKANPDVAEDLEF